MSGVFGREHELAQITRFLGQGEESFAGLLLEGDPGIGKSTLWLAAVQTARECGIRVLSARPAEAERELAYAGLGDLFDDALADVLPQLPLPRRRALEAAFLIEESDGPADVRALGVAVRNAIEVLAAANDRLLIAIDDVQWLDPSSATALSFAFRRLTEQPVLLLLARRVEDRAESSTFTSSLADTSFEQLRVGPLSVGALQRVLHARLGRTLGRPTLLRIHEASGGNAFYALELAAALDDHVDPTQPLPISRTLEDLLRQRLAGLPAETVEALELLSALGRARAALLQVGNSQSLLTPALAAGVVVQTNDTIEFAHPLLSSVVYNGLSPRERRSVHRRAAELVDEPFAHARHLALAADGPNVEVASLLEEEATRTNARGAPIAAAELAEHALRLTPPEGRNERHRRTILAARSHFDAGEPRRAHALAVSLLEQEPVGNRRAEALVLLSEIAGNVDLRREALEEAHDDPAQQARIHQWLAARVRYSHGLRAAESHAKIALELAESLEDDALRAGALAAMASIRFRAGEPDALGLGHAAYELATRAGDSDVQLKVGLELASMLIHCAELEDAVALLATIHSEWSDRAEWVRREVLWRLGLVETLGGRFTTARDHLDRAREIGLQYENDDPGLTALLALVVANQGDVDGARSLAEAARLGAEVKGSPLSLGDIEGALGVIELWSGNPSGAAVHFGAADEGRRSIGFVEPRLFWWRSVYAEALLELGRIDAAVGLLDAWEADAVRLSRDRVLASVTHCRALVAAAQGNVEQALDLMERAVSENDAVDNAFGRAQSLLALGVLRRRRRLQRSAREAIEAALAGFEAGGALGWAEKARAELGRIGGRTRTEGLTPAERRVAALVAEGRTNREVAAALFLGERTVASHLARVYAKLGIRSRSELARRLG